MKPHLILLRPEVAGDLGPGTVISHEERRYSSEGGYPEVSRCEVRLVIWSGDDLLEAFPCFIVTEGLAQTLERAELSGLMFGDVEVSADDIFKEMYPGRTLPRFRRLMPQGTVELLDEGVARRWSGHDLCLGQRADLVITERALDALSNHKIDHCYKQQLHLVGGDNVQS